VTNAVASRPDNVAGATTIELASVVVSVAAGVLFGWG
jgi:hypothetical protein